MSRKLKFLSALLIFILITPIFLKDFLATTDALQKHSSITAKVTELTSTEKKFDASRIIIKYKDGATPDPDLGLIPLSNQKWTPFRDQIFLAKVGEQNSSEESRLNIASTESEVASIQAKLYEFLRDDAVEYAQPNYLSQSSAWTTSGTKAYPGDYHSVFQWYYDQAKLPQMWYDRNCHNGDAACGGSTDVTIAVIDTGLAFESYNDTLTNNFYGNFPVPSNPGAAKYAAGGKNFTASGAQSPEYNAASGFQLHVNQYETANDGIDNDCNGIVDDVNGADMYAYADLYEYIGYPSCINTNTYWFRKAGHPVDTTGHGSMVTGLAAGVVDNFGAGGYVTSPTFNVRVMPVAANMPFQTVFLSSDIYLAISYAGYHGADVINLSMASNTYESVIQDTISWAFQEKPIYDGSINGSVIVAASGNFNSTEAFYPAAYEHVLSVGAYNNDSTKSAYSNYGSGLDMIAYVGDKINEGQGAVYQSTLSCYTAGCSNSSTFSSTLKQYATGTSFASPQIAAAAAIILSNNPDMTPEMVVMGLIASARDIENPGFDATSGFGAVNFKAANAYNETNNMEYYFAKYSHNVNNTVSYIKIGNPHDYTVTVSINMYDVDGLNIASKSYKIPAKGRISHSAEVSQAIVEITATDTIYATEKITYSNNSFTEYPAIPESALDQEYFFPEYNNNGTTQVSYINIVNPTDSDAIVVVNKRNSSGSSVEFDNYNLNAHSRITDISTRTDVAVEVTSNVTVYATQYNLLNSNALNEHAGVPGNALADAYFYPAYANNNSSTISTIEVGNPYSENQTANITIEMLNGSGTVVDSENYTLPRGGTISHSVELSGMAVKVYETNAKKIYTTQRSQVNSSFNEYAGIPVANMGSSYYYPAYANNGAASQSAIKIANPSTTAAIKNIRVELLDGKGVVVHTAFVNLAPSGKYSFSYNKSGVAVRVSHGSKTFYTTLKSILNYNSFGEYPGIAI